MNSVVDYFPYGKVSREYIEGQFPDRFLTTYHERDHGTGLDYRGARFYDSDIGRFLSLDPLAADFAAISPYNYVLGNPLLLVDPNGKSPKDYNVYVDGQKVSGSEGSHWSKEIGWGKSAGSNNIFFRVANKKDLYSATNELQKSINEHPKHRGKSSNARKGIYERELGERVEAAILNGLNTSKFRGSLPNGKVPDGSISSFDMTSFNAYRTTGLIEVKTGKEVTLETQNGQIEGFIDHLAGTRFATDGHTPTLWLITAGDTNIDGGIVDYAAKNGVAVYHSYITVSNFNKKLLSSSYPSYLGGSRSYHFSSNIAIHQTMKHASPIDVDY